MRTQNKSQNDIETLTQAIRELAEEVRHLTQAVKAIPAIRIQENRGGNNLMGDGSAMALRDIKTAAQEPFKAD